MKVIQLQILIIEDMIKIEFKVSNQDGSHPMYIEKMIETWEDYENLKRDLRTEFQSLDDIIYQKLEQNEQRDHKADMPKAEAVGAEV
jgi:hypothetical protein